QAAEDRALVRRAPRRGRYLAAQHLGHALGIARLRRQRLERVERVELERIELQRPLVARLRLLHATDALAEQLGRRDHAPGAQAVGLVGARIVGGAQEDLGL